MFDSWPNDKLVAVALLIAAMTPDSRAAMVMESPPNSLADPRKK